MSPDVDRRGPRLGECCGVGPHRGRVRNVLMLPYRAPVARHGWGCLVCGLPPDGALAVLCDGCVARYPGDPSVLRDACRGYPATDGRVAKADLSEPFDHNMAMHAEEGEA